nr:hypothetical protein [Tanacetum cinerariifolium]
MTSFGYRLNPLYTIKECSSCGALYTTDYCCSNESIVDKIICDLNKAPDSPHLHTFSSNQRHCFHCKDVLGDDGIFCKRCTCKSCGKGAHIGYNCSPKVSVISNPEPCKNQTIDELPQTLLSSHPTCFSRDESPFTCDSTPNIVDDSLNIFNPPLQPLKYSYGFCGNDAYYGYDCPPQIHICYDDDEDYTIAITPKEPDNSLSMGDEHLYTIPATKSDEIIKSSVENLVLNPKSMLNQDYSITSSSSKIDYLLDEFAGELILFKSIPPEIDKADCDPKKEIRLDERLFDPFMEEIDLFLASDGSIPPGIDSAYSDSEEDNLFLERLFHDDPIPLSHTLDFSNVVRVFLPFFTYPVTSSILLSFESEDTIFDLGISSYHFSSLESGVSHRSGTFMKFNVYPNHLNESLMEILSLLPHGQMNSGSSQAQDSVNKNKRFSGGNPCLFFFLFS